MDHDAILSQLEALHADAFGWAVSCCAGDRHRGEEVLQIAYTKVLRGRLSFGGQAAFKTWWFGVIRLTAFEEARRSRRWFSFLQRWWAGSTSDLASPAPESVPEPRDAELAALATAVAQLSERQREVLHLAFYQQLSLSEAAEVMGISVGSARQHYERGKQRLRELLPARRALHE
jgi:RNA polymerase sigma-70 factor (ECF subfamily)